MNTKVKWFNEDYDLGCDVSKLEKLGFTNSSWKDDIAPSYSNDKMQIFFLNKNKFGDYYNRQIILHQWVGRPITTKKE